jgi:uncharacterized protein YecT (DUF1311 family)
MGLTTKKKVLFSYLGITFASFFVHLLPMTAQSQPDCQLEMDRGHSIEYKRCVYLEYQRADNVLNSVWKQVVSQLSKNEKERLIDEQIAWIKESDDICKKENPDWTKSTWVRAALQRCVARVTIQRTRILRGYLK